MPLERRHWRPYHKLSLDEAWHVKQIGRARGSEARVQHAYRRAGRLSKLRQVMRERVREQKARNGVGTPPAIDSTVTVAKVFGVTARAVGMIWQGKYWVDA